LGIECLLDVDGHVRREKGGVNRAGWGGEAGGNHLGCNLFVQIIIHHHLDTKIGMAGGCGDADGFTQGDGRSRRDAFAHGRPDGLSPVEAPGAWRGIHQSQPGAFEVHHGLLAGELLPGLIERRGGTAPATDISGIPVRLHQLESAPDDGIIERAGSLQQLADDICTAIRGQVMLDIPVQEDIDPGIAEGHRNQVGIQGRLAQGDELCPGPGDIQAEAVEQGFVIGQGGGFHRLGQRVHLAIEKGGPDRPVVHDLVQVVLLAVIFKVQDLLAGRVVGDIEAVHIEHVRTCTSFDLDPDRGLPVGIGPEIDGHIRVLLGKRIEDILEPDLLLAILDVLPGDIDLHSLFGCAASTTFDSRAGLRRRDRTGLASCQQADDHQQNDD